jgi:hypothetical protein
MDLTQTNLGLLTHARLLLSTCLVIGILGTAPTHASDLGPTPSVSAIRHSLPLLLAGSLGSDTHKLVVEWVVVDQRDAVAAWRAAGNRGVVVLQLRQGRWWWRAGAAGSSSLPGGWTSMQAPGNVTACGANASGPPTADQLFQQGFVSKKLAAELTPRLRTTPSKSAPLVICDLAYAYFVRDTSEVYGAVLSHKELLPVPPYAVHLAGRIPEDWHKPHVRGASVYYVFNLSVEQPVPILFRTDSTSLDVWFPYVLPKAPRFTLTVRNVAPEITGVRGTLEDNTLHFLLPPFTLPANNVAHGQIDGSM